MNLEKAMAFFGNAENMEAFNACKTAEEKVELVNRSGAEATAEELAGLLKAAVSPKEKASDSMSLDELDTVAGGMAPIMGPKLVRNADGTYTIVSVAEQQAQLQESMENYKKMFGHYPVLA